MTSSTARTEKEEETEEESKPGFVAGYVMHDRTVDPLLVEEGTGLVGRHIPAIYHDGELVWRDSIWRSHGSPEGATRAAKDVLHGALAAALDAHAQRMGRPVD